MNYAETRKATDLCQALVNNLCEEWNLAPIEVVFTGRLQRLFGQAVYGSRQICLNPNLIGTEELNDTLRHEFAHFINSDINHASGHGALWKRAAQAVGAKPQPYASGAEANRIAEASRKRRYICDAGCNIGAFRQWRKAKICIKHRLPLRLLED